MTSVEEDKTGTATIHVWDAFINQIKSGTTYEIENLTVKQFQGITHVGANFFLLFSFSYTYFLSCIIFLCALRYFVNHAPLLPELQVSISVTLFVAVDFFPRFP